MKYPLQSISNYTNEQNTNTKAAAEKKRCLLTREQHSTFSDGANGREVVANGCRSAVVGAECDGRTTLAGVADREICGAAPRRANGGVWF